MVVDAPIVSDPMAHTAMIELSTFKKALGPVAASLTDEQIEQLRVIQDRFADVFFDVWLKKLNDHKGREQGLLKVESNGIVSL